MKTTETNLMEKQLKEGGISILEQHCERMKDPPPNPIIYFLFLFYEGGDPAHPPPKVKFNSRMYF